MQTTKSSTFSVESLISKESFEPRVDAHSCIALPRCSLGPERTRTSPSFTNSITIPRPLALEGVSAGHTSAFSQTSQSPLSSGRTFAIPPRASEHHQGILLIFNVKPYVNSCWFLLFYRLSEKISLKKVTFLNIQSQPLTFWTLLLSSSPNFERLFNFFHGKLVVNWITLRNFLVCLRNLPNELKTTSIPKQFKCGGPLNILLEK